MAELKTKPTVESVESFLDKIEDEKRRKNCYKLLEFMKNITKVKPKMWGSSIIGFGNYHYSYESGCEGDFFIDGFSPRKQNLTLYIMSRFSGSKDLISKLGKYKTGKSCLYVKSLDDIDTGVLKNSLRIP